MMIHIDCKDTGPSAVMPTDNLPPCPVCGATAYLSRDVIDGFFMGFSAGCPHYCLYDGVHGHTFDTPEEDRLSRSEFSSAGEAVAWWKERAARG